MRRGYDYLLLDLLAYGFQITSFLLDPLLSLSRIPSLLCRPANTRRNSVLWTTTSAGVREPPAFLFLQEYSEGERKRTKEYRSRNNPERVPSASEGRVEGFPSYVRRRMHPDRSFIRTARGCGAPPSPCLLKT